MNRRNFTAAVAGLLALPFAGFRKRKAGLLPGQVRIIDEANGIDTVARVTIGTVSLDDSTNYPGLPTMPCVMTKRGWRHVVFDLDGAGYVLSTREVSAQHVRPHINNLGRVDVRKLKYCRRVNA